MKKNKISKDWVNKQKRDIYVRKSKLEGYRSRAIYKLKEIDNKFKIIKNGIKIVDLGSAPGSWSQYLSEKSIKTLSKVKAHDFNAVRKNLNRSKKTSHFGSVFHDVIAKTESKKQIEIVVNDFFNRGLLSKNDKNKMIKMVKSVFNNKKLSHFYVNSDNIYREREIYLSDGKVIKPDRMIFHENKEVSILDYKTGKPKISDNNQIINYISELEKNSYRVREAFLIYLGNKISIIDLIST
mgnify:CR=1 FL=1